MAQQPDISDRASLARQAGSVATAAARLMERDHAWYRALSAEDRSWVGLVAQAGVNAFFSWYRDLEDRHETDQTVGVATLGASGASPTAGPATTKVPPRIATDIFGTAPADLAHTITLRQTLDLVRTTIDAVESELRSLTPPQEQAAVREAVLRYSREVAFAAAEVYAAAAESRGAWDARLESLVVHAVVRGEADDSFTSRAAELGWAEVSGVAVLVGAAHDLGASSITDTLRRAARGLDIPVLSAVQGTRLIAILGQLEDPLDVARGLAPHFGAGPLVVGPRVPHLFAAGRSARAALSALDVCAAWPEAPRPVGADDLLAERALHGEAPARRILIDRIYRRLRDSPTPLLDTASTYLDCGRSLEATSRVLFVHPNTVRYRLRRIEETIALDLSQPREAWVIQVALALGRISDQPSRGWRTAMARPRAGSLGAGRGGGAGIVGNLQDPPSDVVDSADRSGAAEKGR